VKFITGFPTSDSGIAAARGRFSRIRQVAPVCAAIQYMVLAYPSSDHKRAAVFAALTIVTDPRTDIARYSIVTIGRIDCDVA